VPGSITFSWVVLESDFAGPACSAGAVKAKHRVRKRVVGRGRNMEAPRDFRMNILVLSGFTQDLKQMSSTFLSMDAPAFAKRLLDRPGLEHIWSPPSPE
jgi:hypothetical protein